MNKKTIFISLFVVFALLCGTLLLLWYFQQNVASPEAVHPNHLVDIAVTPDKLEVGRLSSGSIAAGVPATAHSAVRGKKSLKAAASTAMLPAENTPWKIAFDELNAAAKNGDKTAANRLYAQTMRCSQYANIIKYADHTLVHPKPVDSMSPFGIKRENESLDAQEKVLDDNSGLCRGVTVKDIQAVANEVLWNAARLGNEAAATCYAAAAFEPPNNNKSGGLSGDQFASNAMLLLKRELAAGNWRAVKLLARYADPESRQWTAGSARELLNPDPMAAYRYVVLQKIGANAAGDGKRVGEFAELLDRYRNMYHLSYEQINEATGWAARTYDENFAGESYPTSHVTHYCDTKS